ncbi:hypothetical protein GCM10027427_12480 [Pseudoclavibacter terrae]
MTRKGTLVRPKTEFGREDDSLSRVFYLSSSALLGPVRGLPDPERLRHHYVGWTPRP